MTEQAKAAASAYRIFASWHHDVVSAGFAATGAPARAYRLLHSAVVRGGPIEPALEAAEDALSEWVAQWNGSPATRAALAEVQTARRELATASV